MKISEILQSLRDPDNPAWLAKYADAIEAAMREKDADIDAFGRAIDNWVEITKNLLTTLGATQDEIERLKSLIVTAYQAAYSRGHEDTVEGCVNLNCIHERECAEEFIEEHEDVLAMLAALNTEGKG